MKISLLSIFLLISTPSLLAQELSFKGKIYDRSTGEVLVGASVHDLSSMTGTFTDANGSFSIKLWKGDHKIRFSHLGFIVADTTVKLSEEKYIEVYLKPSDISLGEVKITAGPGDAVTSSKMSNVTISGKEIAKMPSLLGEKDPLGLLRLTPGVQSGSEAGAGFYVRGGGTDQNLILYDEALIYNPGHVLGFFSVFNPDVVRDVNIIKSGVPSEYGGKISSVMLVKSYTGNRDSTEVTGSAGFISSRLTVSGPVFKKHGSFIIGARRTYIDLLIGPVISKLVKNQTFFNKNNKYNFYDLNGGLSLDLTRRDHLEFSVYSGRDQFKMLQEGIRQKNDLGWGNSLGSLQWSHKVNDRSMLRTSFSATKYNFDLTGSQSDYHFGLYSSSRDFNLKSDITFGAGIHHFKAGFEATEHHFIPNNIDAQAKDFALNFGQFSSMSALEGGLFIDDEFPINPSLSVYAGFRLSVFSHQGPYRDYIRNGLDQVTDTVYYPAGRSIARYANPEPRLILKYMINGNSSLKASYMRMAQYVHLATTASVSLPTDIWIPSTSRIRPMTGDQISLGYFRNLNNNMFEFSGEVYYKEMHNKLEFLRGIIYNSIYGNIEDNIVSGFARAYGAELFLRKKTGKLTGWISYTLSRTEQRFDDINDGFFYPAKYDRRHDITIAAINRFNDKWTCSAVFIFTSGNAFTMPSGRYIIQGNIVNQYGKVNEFRMPPYHRLDLSATRTVIIRKKWTSELNFSLYNAYNRANPYFIYFEAKGDLESYSLRIRPFTVSLFPVIPSVSWNFVF